MLKLTKITPVVFALSFLWTMAYGLSTLHAQVPRLINYQGRLTDKTSKPLEGSYELTFRIYDDEASGTLLWEETHPTVVIQKGIFSILLGSIKALDLPFDKQYFLEIKVGDETMTPRQRIASGAYAIRAENTEKLGGQDSTYYRNVSNINSGILSLAYGGTGRTAKLEAAQVKASNEIPAPSSESDMNDMAVTLDTSGTKLFISFVGKLNTGAESCYAYFKIYLDGGQVGDEWQFGTPSGTTHVYHAAKMQWLATGLTPGSHTVKIKWYGNGGYYPKISNRNLIVLDLE